MIGITASVVVYYKKNQVYSTALTWATRYYKSGQGLYFPPCTKCSDGGDRLINLNDDIWTRESGVCASVSCLTRDLKIGVICGFMLLSLLSWT